MPGNVAERQMGGKIKKTGSFLNSAGFSLIPNGDSPVGAFGQVPRLLCHWLRNMEGRGVLVARTQSVRVQGNTLLGSSVIR